jgi:hypothetical protein
MTIGSLLLLVLGVVVVGLLAYWVITKFFPEPMRMVALAIVGVLLLVVVLASFFPETMGMRVWK